MNPAKVIGLIGLGKMGAGLASNLVSHGWTVHAFNRTFQTAKAMETDGLIAHATLESLAAALPLPRCVWVMVPAGEAVDAMLSGSAGIVQYLAQGDTVIDGGNSNYRDTLRRAPELTRKGLHFLDAGVSGGPNGARHGACTMIGGHQEVFDQFEHLFRDISAPGAYAFFPGHGAGHFVKMVHNGIEYGMMQAIAEGFSVLRKSQFQLDLSQVATIYNRGSVIESRLVGWVQTGLTAYGESLDEVSSTVAHTGEGAWTVEAARELGVEVPIIEGSLEFRKSSSTSPSYTGKLLSMIRNQFGGHSIKSD